MRTPSADWPPAGASTYRDTITGDWHVVQDGASWTVDADEQSYRDHAVEVDAERRSVESKGALTPGDVLANDADRAAECEADGVVLTLRQTSDKDEWSLTARALRLGVEGTIYGSRADLEARIRRHYGSTPFRILAWGQPTSEPMGSIDADTPIGDRDESLSDPRD